MRTTLRALSMALGCALLVVAQARAQVPPPSQSKELVVQNPPSVLTVEFARLIGEIGEKTPVKITRTIVFGDLVRERCGPVAEAYSEALRAANGDPALSLATVLEPGRDILMPPCPPRVQFEAVPVKVKPGDNFSSYWNETGRSLPSGNLSAPDGGDLTVVFDPAAQAPVAADDAPMPVSSEPGRAIPFAVEGKDIGSITFADLATAVNPNRKAPLGQLSIDEEVLVPTVRSQPFALPLPAEVADEPATRAAARASVEAAVGADVEERDGLTFYGSVQPRDCKGGYQSFEEDFENGMLRLFAENRSLAGEESFVPPVIMILDSGLYDQAGIPGKPQVFSDADSSHGENAPKPYWPFDFLRQRMHGTEVASLAIGGAEMSELLRAMDFRQRIQPINIFTSTAGFASFEGAPIIVNGEIPQTTLERIDRSVVVGNLDRFAQIVNMSFGGSGERGLLPRSRIGAQSETLYIVAAGNDHSSLDETDFFPARDGGPASTNVVTVASVDSDGKLSWFSNFSSRFVDIAAPGCRVPVLRYESDPRGLLPSDGTGTSYSAPQVSFVAAMISGAIANSDRSASTVKMRLLASADIVPSLAESVADGRVLNVRKALSLSKDVVEVRDGAETRLKRGRLTDEARSPQHYCDPAPNRPNASLLKVVPRFDGRTSRPDRTWLNFGSRDGLIEAVSCPARAFSLTFAGSSATTETVVQGADVLDVVFRW